MRVTDHFQPTSRSYGAGVVELDLFPGQSQSEQDYSATFADNMSLPVHRWYRYTAGFSASWVRQLIQREKGKKEIRVIDPFSGSGTVLLECEFAGVDSYGLEAQPYVYRISKSKLNWHFPADVFKSEMLSFLRHAKTISVTPPDAPKLIASCYPPEILQRLETLKHAWQTTSQPPNIRDFIWFVITSILRVTSPVGTAQWQYIQPSKTKANVLDPFVAFERKVLEMHADMKFLQSQTQCLPRAIVLNQDSRDIKNIPEGWGNLVVTSPPYANNYDYADATRLEMTFWGDIAGWSDLQDNVRSKLVRACTQHVSGMGAEMAELLAHPRLAPINGELRGVFNALQEERLKHGGKKNYHHMIAAYFKDLADVFHSLRRITSGDCEMCFVIGDSAPYGVYVPVDKWLGDLALSAGFKSYSFEKLRDRNVKWKNRKHTVPLHEGRLWIRG